MAKIISKCYDIQENDGNIAGCKEWAEARKAIDTAIFKAGYEQGYVEGCFGIIEETQKAHRAGIEEVVEWIENKNDIDAGYPTRKAWVAKLKEWGIKND